MSAHLQRSEIGTVGSAPGTLLLHTTDTFATITTAGYIQKVGEASGAYPKPTDFVFVNYSNGSGLFTISNTNGVFTLVSDGSPVVTPTTANHIATYTNTSGSLSEDANPAINNGVIQSGSSGTAGGFIAYPSTASKGYFEVLATANTGNTNVTLTNDAHGQTTAYSLPDCGNAVGQVLNAATATPFTTGHLISASGTAGVTTDSGILATNVVSKAAANTFAAGGSIILNKVNGTESGNAVTASGVAGLLTTSSLSTAAGGSYSITWTNTAITSTSVVLLQLSGGTNTTESVVLKVTPGSGTATLVIYNVGPTNALNGTILISYLVM